MHFLRKYVLPNAALKLLALAMAFSVWAGYAAQPLAQIGYDAALVSTNVPDNVTIPADAPATVRLLIRGREPLLRRIGPGDLTLTVDLADLSPGQAEVPLSPQMAAAPLGTDV